MNIGHIYFALSLIAGLCNLVVDFNGYNPMYIDFLLTIQWVCIPFQLYFYFVDELELSLD